MTVVGIVCIGRGPGVLNVGLTDQADLANDPVSDGDRFYNCVVQASGGPVYWA